ncbi:hypothetical protein E3J84_05505 [Candidatus Aerophobetes bacterium]|uniref:Uncharacterized protein n=1 Tax=Aerophobetes bacterium TaxID=2030807 RepID=A0A523RTK5_UNCAE|nr:MAG: hypothetical protein E3J84_05505 [Candidatus Aerophobetes bacterium]
MPLTVYRGLGTKEEILKSLDTAISAVSGIAYVDWQRSDPTGIDPDRYPGVFINDLRIDRVQLLGDIWKNTYTVALVGFVWAEDDENLGTILNTFITAVKTAVLGDISRNNNAYDTDIEIIATDAGSKHPQGEFIMSLLILFYSAV